MSNVSEASVSFRVEKVWKEGFVITKYINSEMDSVLSFTHVHSTMENTGSILQFTSNKLINLRIRTGKVKRDGQTVSLYTIDTDAIYNWLDGLQGDLLLKDEATGESFIIESIAHNEASKNLWIAELNH